ncbi:MAG: hypothetical protein ACP5L1_00920 [Caldivirga sp.]|uniref:hypothetical protein n=1 Tax=Caldivirga sp. TaxID=2080243 RepID=UPI003D0DA86F
MHKIKSYILLTTAVVTVMILVYGINVAYAQQSYPRYNLTAVWGVPTVAPWPSTWWNPFAPSNLPYILKPLV